VILEETKDEIEHKFSQLEAQRKQLQSQVNEITTEMIRLQGEHRIVIRMLEDNPG